MTRAVPPATITWLVVPKMSDKDETPVPPRETASCPVQPTEKVALPEEVAKDSVTLVSLPVNTLIVLWFKPAQF